MTKTGRSLISEDHITGVTRSGDNKYNLCFPKYIFHELLEFEMPIVHTLRSPVIVYLLYNGKHQAQQK